MRSARRLIGSLALLLVLGIQGLAAAETPSDLSGAVTPSLVQLTWTPQLGTPFVVFRRAPSAAITSLSSGTAYGIGAVVGSSTCVGLPVVANLVDSGLAPATAYAYDVFASAAGNTYTACATIAVATAALPTPALTAITPSISPPQPISGVVITGTQIITPTSFWPGDALAFGANGYESVYTFQHQDNWEEAETEAEQAGGFLATVDSAAMDPFFLSFPQFEEDDLAYIGLWDPSGTGTFQWVDGEPLTYTEWYDPQTTSGPYVVMGGGPSCAVPSTIWDQANNSDIAFTSFFEFPAPGPVLPGVVLRRPGQADIPATAVAEGSGQALTCSFDLTGALDGLWDVVLTDAFGEVTTLPNAFLVHTAPVAGPLTCLQFDGIQDVGGTPLTAALAVGTQETIEGWFKTTSTANAGLFMNLASEPNANGLVASLQQGQVAGVADLGGWQTVSPPTVVNDGQWHHVACIMDGESVTTVLDGVPAGPAFGSALLAGAGQPSGILFGDGLYGFFQGELADMRCWDAALPVGVISAWRGARVTPAHPYAAHLLAEYRCDDGSGDTASDSAHGITATLYNAPQWQPGLVFFAGTEGQPLTGTLTGSDADNDPLTYSVLQEPSSGTVVLDPASGDFTYTPAAGVFGFDRFTYQVDDGLAASAPTQVNLFLAEVGSAAPIADAASVTVISNATANGTLQASDAAGIALTYAIASQPSHGSVVLLNPYSGAYSYTSAANYVGPDAVTFTASDGVTLSAPATIAIGSELMHVAPAGSTYPIRALPTASDWVRP